MEVSVSDAKAQLTDLVRRAEKGEEIVLTRHGQATAKIVPLTKPKPIGVERRKALDEIVARAQEKLKHLPRKTLKEIDRELYGEDGLPK